MKITPVAIAWFDTWRGTHYDLSTGEIVRVGDPPPYAIAHEAAHRWQHRKRTRLFRLWQRWPNKFTLFLLEIDADCRARQVLRDRGQFDAINLLASNLSRNAAWAAFLEISQESIHSV